MPEAKRYVLSTAAGRSDDLIEIGGREFRADPFKLAESNKFKGSDSYYGQLKVLAEPLERRAVDKKPVTVEWLAEEIDKPFLDKLLTLLVNGSLETDPKA